MTENNTSITSQEQYNEVRAQLENLIREATEKGMLESDADNEYTKKIGELARLTAAYEDNYMNILPLKAKNSLSKIIEEYVEKQLENIEKDVSEMEKLVHTLLTIHVAIEQGTDGTYSAYIADEDCEFGCIGEGKTIEETKADFMKAVEDMKAVYAGEGKKFPNVIFEFKNEQIIP